jgi:hypothetical protein
VALLAGASRLDRNAKKLPSFAQRGDVSFFSLLNVSCRVDGTPCVIDTTWMSV